jgi:uncharacterized membrane protein
MNISESHPVRQPFLSTKRIVLASIVGALYAVFTIALAPASYGPIQMRFSEALKALALIDPAFGIGIGIGNIFANLASPQVGPWELIFMPITDFLGGIVIWLLFGRFRKLVPDLIGVTVYAITTGFSVGFMLFMMGISGVGVWLTSLPIIASELIVMIPGYFIMIPVSTLVRKRFFEE